MLRTSIAVLLTESHFSRNRCFWIASPYFKCRRPTKLAKGRLYQLQAQNNLNRPVRLSELNREKTSSAGTGDLQDTQVKQNKFQQSREGQVETEPESALWSCTKQKRSEPQPRIAVQSTTLTAIDAPQKNESEWAYERAKASAAGSLQYRAYSRAELKEKLLLKGHAIEGVERALDRLAEVELQSDFTFAEAFARAKWRQNRWAPSRIDRDLTRRGVSAEDREAALQEVFGSNVKGIQMTSEVSNEDGSSTGLDQQLLHSVKRRLEGMGGLSKNTQKRRLIGWLQRRGHSWEVVQAVMREVSLFP